MFLEWLFLRNTKHYSHWSCLSLKVVPLCNYTFLPAIVQVLVTFLEAILCSLVNLFVTFCMMSVASNKHHPFSADFSWGNKYILAGARSGEYWGCSSVVTLFFAKKSLDQNWPLWWSIVVKEKPTVCSPFFWAFHSDYIPKAMNVNVHFFINSSNSCKLYQ
jgi:hypothetical protein